MNSRKSGLGVRARLARARRRNVEKGGGTVTLKTKKIFLSVGSNLDGGLGSDVALNGFPFATVEGKGGDETFVFVVGPVFTTFG